MTTENMADIENLNGPLSEYGSHGSTASTAEAHNRRATPQGVRFQNRQVNGEWIQQIRSDCRADTHGDPLLTIFSRPDAPDVAYIRHPLTGEVQAVQYLTDVTADHQATDTSEALQSLGTDPHSAHMEDSRPVAAASLISENDDDCHDFA